MLIPVAVDGTLALSIASLLKLKLYCKGKKTPYLLREFRGLELCIVCFLFLEKNDVFVISLLASLD